MDVGQPRMSLWAASHMTLCARWVPQPGLASRVPEAIGFTNLGSVIATFQRISVHVVEFFRAGYSRLQYCTVGPTLATLWRERR